MKIIIDANIYLSAIIYDSVFLKDMLSRIYQENSIIQSQQIIQEVLDVATRNKEKNKWESINVLYDVLNLNKHFYYFNNRDIDQSISLRDKQDKHIIQLAKMSRADYILTGDKDLLQSDYKKITISPTEYFNKYINANIIN